MTNMEKFDTEEFIQAVQAREPIWLTTHPKHKHKKTVNKMWNDIAKQFPYIHILALKKKWKNLRDSFKRELKKNPNLQSRWSYFSLMKFIAPYDLLTTSTTTTTTTVSATATPIEIITPSPITTTAATTINTVTVTANEHMPLIDMQAQQTHEQQLQQQRYSHLVTATSGSDISETTTTTTTSSRGRKRKVRQLASVYDSSDNNNKITKTDELDLLIDKQSLQPIHQQQLQQQQLNHQTTQLEENSNNMLEFMVDKNDDYHFFMSLLPQMAKFEMLQKLRIRQNIQQIIIDEACLIHNTNNYTNS